VSENSIWLRAALFLESHNQQFTTQLRDVEQDRERLLEKTSDLEQRLETLTATHQERARTIEQITAGHERVASETRDQLQGLQSRNQQLQDQIGDLQQDRERLLENTSDLRQELETSKAAHQKSTHALEQLRTEQEQAESDARKQVLGLQSHNQQLQDQMGDLEQHRIQLQQNCDLLEGRLKQQAAELALAGDRLEQTESDLRSQASERVVKNRKLEEQIRGYEQQRLQQERECDAAEQDHRLQAQEMVCLQEALERRMTEAEQVESELRQQIADLTAHRRPRPTRLSEPQRPRIDPRASTWPRGPARPDVQPDVQAEPAARDLVSYHPVQHPRPSRRMARLCRETPSSARERAVFSPGKDDEAGDVGFIVDGVGCSKADNRGCLDPTVAATAADRTIQEKGPLEARSSFPTQPRPLNESYRSTGASATPDDRSHQDSGHSHLPHEDMKNGRSVPFLAGLRQPNADCP